MKEKVLLSDLWVLDEAIQEIKGLEKVADNKIVELQHPSEDIPTELKECIEHEWLALYGGIGRATKNLDCVRKKYVNELKDKE